MANMRKLMFLGVFILLNNNIFTKVVKNLPSLPEVDRVELPGKVLKYQDDFPKKNELLRKYAADELKIVSSKDDSASLFNAVKRTETWYGDEALKALLLNPLNKKQESLLRQRQELVRRLTNSPELLAETHTVLDNVAKHQENIFLLWSLANPFNNLMDLQAMLNQLTGAKKSKVAMEVVRGLSNGFISIGTLALIYFTGVEGHYKINNYYSNVYAKTDYQHDDSFVLTGILAVSTAFWLYKIVPAMKNSESVNKKMQELMISVGETVQSANGLVNILEKVAGSENALKYSSNIRNYAQNTERLDKELQYLLSELKTLTFTDKPSFFSYMGRVRECYALVLELKESLVPLLKAIGEIDAYVSFANLILEHKDKSVHYSFAKFVESDDFPVLKLSKSWNPLVKSEKIITEDIALGGGENLIPNMLITGPHGGGKSSLIKQVAYNVVLAQVCGVGCADECELTLFDFINTYCDIQDNVEKAISAFMAERKRMDMLDLKIRRLQDGHFALTLIDEPYKATMEKEASNLLIEFMARTEQVSENISLMASHFIEPAIAAEERKNSKYLNYNMATEERNPGRFRRLFTLNKGKCDWWFTDNAKRARYVNWLQSAA